MGAKRPPVSWVPIARENAPIPNFLVSKFFVGCKSKEFEIVEVIMILETLDTVDQVMAALGGNRPVETLTGSKSSAVSMWRKANSFPSKKYLVMIEALHRQGKTAPAALWNMQTSAVPPLAPVGEEQNLSATSSSSVSER